MGILSNFMDKFREIDDKIFKKNIVPMIKNNEAQRIKAYNEWLPFLVKVWKMIHPDYEVNPRNLTIPLPEVLYHAVYVKPYTTKETLVIAETLAKYAKSNTDFSIALEELLNYRGLSPYKRKVFGDIMDDMAETGAPIYDAMRTHMAGLIDDKLIRSIEVGLQSNKLYDSLENYIEDLRYDMKNGARIKKALAYPMIIMLTILGISVAGKVVLIPQLFGPLGIEGDALPSELDALIFTADLVLKPWTMMEYLLYISIIVFGYKNSKSFASILDVVILKLPVIGPYLITKDICFFFRHLYSYIDSGAATLEAHTKSCEALSIHTLKVIFESKTEDIIGGKSLSTAYLDVTFLKEDLKMILAVSEKNGDLSEALFNGTNMLKDEYQQITDNLVEQIPTMSTLVAGVAILIIFMPVLSVVYNLDKYLIQ